MKNILLVEDDPVLNDNIRDALMKEHDLRVHAVFDGLMAEKMLRQDHYDCVILDINLPYRNGYEVCKVFRSYDKTTPVLILTAFDELEDKVRGFGSGADDYLTKPFFMTELLLRVQALFKRGPLQHDASPSAVVAGDLVIDTHARKVHRQGEAIALTPREYQILLRLVSAQGELVTKQELIREIWGKAFDANTNTVEVYINFLRKKVDKPFGTQSIKTRVGFGYYYEAT
ncbi:MAG: response regulator transcription factor [Bacteroidia bacterium]